MAKAKEYSNGEVTVTWKPEFCIHSAKCVGNLPEVFKTTEKPWIQVDNSNTNDIIKTVKKCPSGALNYYMNATGNVEGAEENKNNITTKIEVMENGPLMVYGALSVYHLDGSEQQKNKITAFCRCGKTGNTPFCDGSHKK